MKINTNIPPPKPFKVPAKPKRYIGIDPGVNTGFAVWNREAKELQHVSTLMLHQAMALVEQLYTEDPDLQVIIEDARLVRFKTSAARQQGAGSVKRDCKAWEDYLKAKGIPYQFTRPNKAITKYTADQFTRYTGYAGRTSSHARDAAMLVYKL